MSGEEEEEKKGKKFNVIIRLILISLAAEIIENYHANIVVFRNKHCSAGVRH